MRVLLSEWRGPHLLRDDPVCVGLTLYALCRPKKAADEFGILLAGPAFYARGHVDDGGAREADRLGDVVRGEPAGEHEWHFARDAEKCAPIEGRTVPSGTCAASRGTRIEQDKISGRAVALRRLDVFGRLDRDRLHDRY